MKISIPFFLFFCSTLGHAYCPFCNTGVIEKQIIFENQHLLVIYDRAPITQGHLLIIPKRHIAMAHELSQDEWGEFAYILPLVEYVSESF